MEGRGGKAWGCLSPPIPHLFSQPHTCFSDTLDPSFHNKGDAPKLGLINRYFSKDEHSVKTKLYFYYKWEICYSENEAWELDVKCWLWGVVGYVRLLVYLHGIKMTPLSLPCQINSLLISKRLMRDRFYAMAQTRWHPSKKILNFNMWHWNFQQKPENIAQVTSWKVITS